MGGVGGALVGTGFFTQNTAFPVYLKKSKLRFPPDPVVGNMNQQDRWLEIRTRQGNKIPLYMEMSHQNCRQNQEDIYQALRNSAGKIGIPDILSVRLTTEDNKILIWNLNIMLIL